MACINGATTGATEEAEVCAGEGEVADEEIAVAHEYYTTGHSHNGSWRLRCLALQEYTHMRAIRDDLPRIVCIQFRRGKDYRLQSSGYESVTIGQK